MMTLSELDTTGIESQDEIRLYETCLKGSREELRNYCQGGTIQSMFIKDGMNPMHIVAMAGRSDAEAILQMMLENGFDINTQTKWGEDTVLHLIVEHVELRDSFPLVLKMMEYNPDLTIRNRKLRTPYDIAMARDQFELAQVLAGNMSLAQAQDFYKHKIGALYGVKGQGEGLQSDRLLHHDTLRQQQGYTHSTSVGQTRNDGPTMTLSAMLIEAVIKSKESDIEMYLKLGADPNFVNEHKNAPIHYAITHCKLPPSNTLKMLIDKSADVNLQDDEGDTALNLVIKSERLRNSGEMYKCAELLVNQGALSTYRDLDGYDALQLATKRDYRDIMGLLTGTRQQHVRETPRPLPPPPIRLPTPEPEIEEEEEPEEPAPAQLHSLPPLPFGDENDHSSPHPPPLNSRPPDTEADSGEETVPEGEEPVPQYIMDDILTFREHYDTNDWEEEEWENDDGYATPDDLGVEESDVEAEDGETVRQLKKSLIKKEKLLNDYLIRSVTVGTVDEVNDALTRLGVDPNTADSKGLYALHYCCTRDEFENGEEDRIEMIKLLLDNGADVNVTTQVSNSTALHITATNNQDHVAQLLLDTHKCNYNMKNKNEKTAYEVAEADGNREVMEVISKHRQRVGDRFRRAAKASTCTIL